ncbi:DUF2094 domain-containing protein, partial [Pseudomonas aeruginosa]|nr:DUF2094 domain-containing protein [Pseudomonas aeruginosa]
MNSVGFYGKLAGRGDFVSCGLPNTFVEPWDAGVGSRLRPPPPAHPAAPRH